MLSKKQFLRAANQTGSSACLVCAVTLLFGHRSHGSARHTLANCTQKVGGYPSFFVDLGDSSSSSGFHGSPVERSLRSNLPVLRLDVEEVELGV